MRRCVGVAVVTATSFVHPVWRGGLPVTGGPTSWNSMCFHSSSKFIGRKTGGSKKLGDTLCSSATGAGGSDATAAAETKSSTTTPSSSSSSSTTAAAASGNTDGRKKQRDRYTRKSMRNSTERSTASSGGKEVTGSVGGRRAVPAVTTIDPTPDKATLMAERASITKLFMVSDCVASIFCALPQDQRSIDNYLKEVDRAVVPLTEAGDHVEGEETTRQQAASIAMREIAQRVLSEERADHSLCIHVRNMEQLVPPPHLLLDAENNNSKDSNNTVGNATTGLETGVVSTGTSKKAVNKTRRRAASKCKSKASPPPPVLTPAANEKSLTVVERVMALQKWLAEAWKSARESQERYKIPDDYHTITRVRFHDPHKADLTVVQGCGGSKSVVDVLSAMNRNLKHQSNDEADETVSSGNNTSTKDSADVLLSIPFALKPLLSVVASCIPRRESSLGSRCGEEVFFSSPAYTITRRLKRQGGNDIPTTDCIRSSSASYSSSSSSSMMREEELLARRLPPMPRYTTRVTVLVEHDELQPVDLLSMAERSTTRREERDKSSSTTKVGGNSKKKKKCHIYCLIADGGEF